MLEKATRNVLNKVNIIYWRKERTNLDDKFPDYRVILGILSLILSSSLHVGLPSNFFSTKILYPFITFIMLAA